MSKRRKKQASTQSRADAWVSLATGHGTGRDRRTTFGFQVGRIAQKEAEDIYRGDGLAAQCIEELPSEMFRKGFSVVVSDEGGAKDKDATQKIKDWLDELEVDSKLLQADCWARAYGGGGVVIGAVDGVDASMPINLDAVKSVGWLTVFSAYELQPAEWYDDPAHPLYGQPSIYRVTPQSRTSSKGLGHLVHESRVLRFTGVEVSRRQIEECNGWGDSILVRLHSELRDLGAAWGGIAHLMTEFGQGTLAIPDLMKIIAGGDVGAMNARLSAFQLMRSTIRTAVVDAGDGQTPAESFRRESTPLAGAADILDRFAQRLAAVAGLPVSRLFGQSPGGLANSDEGQIRWFYDRVSARQTRVLRPQVNKLLRIVLRAQDGPTGGVEPESWRVVFTPLLEMSESERAEIRLKQSQIDAAYIQAGVLDPAEVAVSRFGGDEWSTETQIDREPESDDASGVEE